MRLTSQDKKIIQLLQEDLPDTITPYKTIASRLGISENQLLAKIARYRKNGILRRLGAVVRHQEVGYTHNMLVVWEVSEHLLAATGNHMSAHPEITHCYERATLPEWPYNLFTMVHGTSRKACEDFVERMSREAGIDNYQILKSLKELKKTSMKYFIT